jgi:hypothetical protein
MSYVQIGLEEKILAMYPEIKEHDIGFSMSFILEENAWLIKLKKDHHELGTFLGKEDADECMEGIFCVHLGVKFGDFLENFAKA